MSNNRQNGDSGCLEIAIVVLILLWVLGFFNDKPKPVTIPEVHGCIGGGMAVVVAGGWDK